MIQEVRNGFNNWREESIKTRIETNSSSTTRYVDSDIEEKNPLKQGLKLTIKRIALKICFIEEKNPLKQGLKPETYWRGN